MAVKILEVDAGNVDLIFSLSDDEIEDAAVGILASRQEAESELRRGRVCLRLCTRAMLVSGSAFQEAKQV